MHPRRTVDLDIPRRVAPLQSPTLLLQALEVIGWLVNGHELSERFV